MDKNFINQAFYNSLMKVLESKNVSHPFGNFIPNTNDKEESCNKDEHKRIQYNRLHPEPHLVDLLNALKSTNFEEIQEAHNILNEALDLWCSLEKWRKTNYKKNH